MFCAVKVPLLLVGEIFNYDKAEGEAREGEVREGEGLVLGLDFGGLGEEEECVGRRVDEEEQRGLGETDEKDVEDHEQEAVVDLRAHDSPAVVFGTRLVPAFAPIVER